MITNDFRGRARSRSAVTFEENESNLTNNNNNSAISERQFQSAVDRRRSFINERPKTAISGIVRSYSSSSFESPDENSDSDSSWDEEVTSTANHDNSNSSLRTNSTQVTTTVGNFQHFEFPAGKREKFRISSWKFFPAQEIFKF